METLKELPVILCKDQSVWATWLQENHAHSAGAWLKIAKKSSGKSSVTYGEALDEALCYGWIDSMKRSYDDSYFLQKFTPRGPKSVWSKVNVRKSQELIKAGKMQPAGLAAIQAAKDTGAWLAAY